MKKLTPVLAVLLIVVLAVVGYFVANGSAKAEILKAEDGVLVFRINETIDNATVLDALAYLKQEGLITYTAQSSTYGAYITEINGVSEYGTFSWMLYCNDASASTTEYGSFTYDEIVLGSCSYGASTQPVLKGCIYAIVLEDWSTMYA